MLISVLLGWLSEILSRIIKNYIQLVFRLKVETYNSQIEIDILV